LYPRWVLWAELGIVVVVSGAFLSLGYLLCKRHRWAKYAAVTVGAVCLLYRILTSTFPHRFYIELPYLVRSGVITPAGFLLLAAALAFATRKSRQRILVGVFSVVLTYYVFCDAAYLVVKGPEIARLTGRWEQETMRQSRLFTCGPAAGATLLRAWGIQVTEGELAFAARTSFRGTELPLLADAIRNFGRRKPLTVKILSATFEGLAEIDRPAILLVVKEKRRRHAVTLLKMSDGKVLIGDPARGSCLLETSEFNRRYKWNGRAIVAWRDPAFERRSDEPPDPTLRY